MNKIPKEEWENCPLCPNTGSYGETVPSYHTVTREMASDAGDLSLEGSSVCFGSELEEVQCEFCWTNPKSVFYQKNELWKNETKQSNETIDDLPF